MKLFFFFFSLKPSTFPEKLICVSTKKTFADCLISFFSNKNCDNEQNFRQKEVELKIIKLCMWNACMKILFYFIYTHFYATSLQFNEFSLSFLKLIFSFAVLEYPTELCVGNNYWKVANFSWFWLKKLKKPTIFFWFQGNCMMGILYFSLTIKYAIQFKIARIRTRIIFILDDSKNCEFLIYLHILTIFMSLSTIFKAKA